MDLSRSMPDVEDINDLIPFVDAVDNSVNGGFLPEKQLMQFLVFGDDRAASGESFQTINRFS
jgi:hypothetical protein